MPDWCFSVDCEEAQSKAHKVRIAQRYVYSVERKACRPSWRKVCGFPVSRGKKSWS